MVRPSRYGIGHACRHYVQQVGGVDYLPRGRIRRGGVAIQLPTRNVDSGQRKA
jgi:hypothetical protein